MRIILLVLLLVALLLSGFAKADVNANLSTEKLYELALSRQEGTHEIPRLYAQLVERLNLKQSSESFEVFWKQAIQSNWSAQDLRILQAVLNQWQDLYPSKKSESRSSVHRDLNASRGLELFDPELRKDFPQFTGEFYILKNYRVLEKRDLEELHNEEARFVIFSKEKRPVGFWGKISDLSKHQQEITAASDLIEAFPSLEIQPTASFKEPMPEESQKSWIRPASVVVGVGLAVLAASYLKDKNLVIRR